MESLGLLDQICPRYMVSAIPSVVHKTVRNPLQVFHPFKPEMHIQIEKDYFESHFHNLSADFNFDNFHYEKVIPRHQLKVRWEEQECKIFITKLIQYDSSRPYDMDHIIRLTWSI